MPATIEDVLKKAKACFREAGISSWALDAEIIVAHGSGLSREQLITHNRQILAENEAEIISLNIEKRLKLMPVQYIINKAEFMALDFYVDENVLIPRPDTEIVTEAAIDFINKNGAKTVLDMCTGSGAIAVSIAKYCNNINMVTAVDISEKALEIAEKNGAKNNVLNKMKFICSDMFKNVEGKFDIIISNPPYISHAELAELNANVIDYEPHLALDGGKDGLGFYRIIGETCGNFLSKDGVVFLEIGAYQKSEIIETFKNHGLRKLMEIKDLAGLDRTLVFGENI